MKHTSELFRSSRWFAAGVTALALLSPSIPSSNAVAPGKQPNFIVILGEGAGWTSTSVQMDDRNPASKGADIKTPNLERLAAAGMRFSDGYAASPRCTPSRAAIFTGKSPAQLYMTFIGEGKKDSGTDVNGRVIPPLASM